MLSSLSSHDNDSVHHFFVGRDRLSLREDEDGICIEIRKFLLFLACLHKFHDRAPVVLIRHAVLQIDFVFLFHNHQRWENGNGDTDPMSPSCLFYFCSSGIGIPVTRLSVEVQSGRKYSPKVFSTTRMQSPRCLPSA